MKVIKMTTMAMLLSLISTIGFAQDIHWAHIHASPTYLNPAMNGVFNDGIVRFIGNSRSQWNSITNGYKTAMVSADMKLIENTHSFVSGGLEILADKAGDLGFSTTKIGLSGAVSKAINYKSTSFISLGFQGAFQSNGFDPNKMVGFDAEPLIAAGIPNRVRYADLNVGAAWYYTWKNRNSIHLGGSLFHINKADVSFISRLENQPIEFDLVIRELHRRWVFTGGANLKLSSNITMMPSVLYQDQGPHKEITMGSFFKVMKDDRGFSESEYAIYLGGWLRWYSDSDLSVAGADAIIASIRADYKRTSLGFSYDITVSSLSRASAGAGGPELSIIQILDNPRIRSKRTKITCPSM